MAPFIGYSDVEQTYQIIKATGITTALFGLSMTIAIVITIWKMTKQYWDGATSKDKDMKKYIDIFKPILPYAFIIIAMPFIISLVEHLFSEMEQLLFESTGSEPLTSVTEAWEQEAEALDEEYGSGFMNWGLDATVAYISVLIVKPLMIFIDDYIFSMALAGRFLYLLLLEIAAPFAIVALLFEKTEHYFWSWLKNMFVCYLLIPGFMLATVFANALYAIFFEQQGLIDGFTVLFIIALKLFLYKQVATRTSQLIS